MKIHRSWFLCTCGLTLLCRLALAQPPPPLPPPGASATEGPASRATFERRVRVFRGDEGPGTEPATFLGVETLPVSPTLTAQLGLPKGAGLVVGQIVPDSPAAASLQPHDILLKLDDQVLIEPRQFSVLVRNHNEGDEVTLTYVRAGKQGTAKVKLTKREVPKMAFFFGEGNGAFMTEPGMPGSGARERMDHVLSLVGREHSPGAMTVSPAPPPHPGFRGMKVNPGNSNLVYNDDQGALDLTIKGGVKTLIAKNAKGEQIFAGPVTTLEERKALPPDLRGRLEQLEGMHNFSFQTDEEFRDHLKVLEPHRLQINLSRPEDPRDEAVASPAL